MKPLLKRIEAYMDRHKMDPTAFGLAAINDGHLYSDLKSGRQLGRRLTLKIEEFMNAEKKRK